MLLYQWCTVTQTSNLWPSSLCNFLPLSLFGPCILLSSLFLKHILFPCCWNYNEGKVYVFLCMLQSASLPRVFRLFRGLGLRHLAIVNDTNEVGCSSVFLNLTMCSWKGKESIHGIGSGRNTWRFCNTAVSGIVGMGNLSLSALLARLKAFQLPWNNGL